MKTCPECGKQSVAAESICWTLGCSNFNRDEALKDYVRTLVADYKGSCVIHELILKNDIDIDLFFYDEPSITTTTGWRFSSTLISQQHDQGGFFTTDLYKVVFVDAGVMDLIEAFPQPEPGDAFYRDNTNGVILPE